MRMKLIKTILPYLVISFIVKLAVIALIWLDHETTKWSQVFGYNMLVGILLYGIPLMIVISLVFYKLRQYLGVGFSILIAFMGGIPLTAVIMFVIYLLIF